MLKTLLKRSAESQKYQDEFILYIIAASFRKMNSRMNTDISRVYFDCLCNQMTFPFDKLPRKADERNHDQAFLKAIPQLADKTQTSIPNLLRTAKLPQPTEIYNTSTYMEFHLLLCELITRFRESLERLQDLGALKREVKFEDLLQYLQQVYVFGYYLGTMVRSSAIEIHLQTIACHLVVDFEKPWTPEGEEDTDFQHLKPYSMRNGKILLPWESYRDWLKLMLLYFDAAQVLLTHVNSWSPHIPAISITIITPPVPNKMMLPWSDLLENKRLFPTLDGEPSGKDFVEFLKNKSNRDLEPMSIQKVFYNSLDTGPLKTGRGFSGTHHCEAFIASLLTLEPLEPYVSDFEDQVNTGVDIERIKVLLDKIKACHFFMNRLNLC
jgi:hypothetical protein